jgi:hypothetical protein
VTGAGPDESHPTPGLIGLARPFAADCAGEVSPGDTARVIGHRLGAALLRFACEWPDVGIAGACDAIRGVPAAMEPEAAA